MTVGAAVRGSHGYEHEFPPRAVGSIQNLLDDKVCVPERLEHFVSIGKRRVDSEVSFDPSAWKTNVHRNATRGSCTLGWLALRLSDDGFQVVLIAGPTVSWRPVPRLEISGEPLRRFLPLALGLERVPGGNDRSGVVGEERNV